MYTDKYKTFLKKMKRARKKAGLTQIQVAKALGETQSYVSKIENGERRIDIIEVQDIAKLYKTKITSLLP